MYRFYIDESQYDGRYVRITGSDVNHIVNVLRLKKDDWIVACNGHGMDHVGRIWDETQDTVTVLIEKSVPTRTELSASLVLFQGIPKGDKMDLIVQKAVEIGAVMVVPVAMKRCVSRITDENKKKKKTKRWQAIAESAAKQCDRAVIPKVHEPVSFSEALKMAGELEYNLIPYELQEGMDVSKKRIEAVKGKKSCGIFIGPEGGLEKEEVEEAENAGILPVSLGRRILRTETAGMVMLSILMYILEE